MVQLLFAATFAVVLGLAALISNAINVTWVLVISFVSFFERF